MAKKRRGPIAANELMERLNNDPEYQARMAEREKTRSERARFWAKAERPVVADLQAVGVQVDAVWDLLGSAERDPEALPVLLKHLQLSYPDKVKEGVARALAVPEARSGWEILLAEFERDPDTKGQGAKWGIACALTEASDETVVDDVVRLLRDGRHGDNGIALLTVLARSSREDMRALLEEFSSDPVLGKEATALLRKKSRKRLPKTDRR